LQRPSSSKAAPGPALAAGRPSQGRHFSTRPAPP